MDEEKKSYYGETQPVEDLEEETASTEKEETEKGETEEEKPEETVKEETKEETNFGGKITDYSARFFGLCEDCLKETQKETAITQSVTFNNGKMIIQSCQPHQVLFLKHIISLAIKNTKSVQPP